MPDDPGANLGEVTPRKKAGFTTYLIIGVIAVLIIGGVMLFTGGNGNGDKPGNDGTNSGTPAVTLPHLKSSIDSLNAKLDGFSGRLANTETTIAGLSAPTVTKAEFNSLQASVNDLSDSIANWSGSNASGSLDYWLTKDKNDGDIRLHVLSAKDVSLIAEVTLFYDTPIQLPSATDGTYGGALLAFYDQIEIDRDYVPNLIPTGSPGWNIAYNNVTYNNLTWVFNGVTYVRNLTTPIKTSSITSITTSLSWEYSVVTFHVGPFEVAANELWDDYIDKDSLLEYDTIGIKLFPSHEETGSSGGADGL